MKYAGSIAVRNPSVGEEVSAREIRRKGLFARMIVALHVSRRRQARQLVRHYRFLIAEESLYHHANRFADFNTEKESNRNAYGDQTSVRTNHRTAAGA